MDKVGATRTKNMTTLSKTSHPWWNRSWFSFSFLVFQNDADLIVSYSTYQAETTAISTGPGRGSQAVGSAGVGSASGGVISASSSGQRRIIATSSGSTRHPGPGGAAIGKLSHHKSCSFVGIEFFFLFESNKIEVRSNARPNALCIVCTRYE